MVFNCYIDEAGDEGIGTGGSRWFILGAILVPDNIDPQTSTMVNRIKKTFGKSDHWTLHWCEIKKHDQKRYICQELQTEQWTFACVAADKNHPYITKALGLKEKYALYHYSARLLIERLSWYARDNGNEKALPIFEYRSNISYDEMREYFRHLRSWMPPTRISWSNVEHKHFKILPKKNSRLLQATDCLCGAVKDALEYSGYGFVEPSYILSMGGRFYRHRGGLFSYGLKFLHANHNVLLDLKKEYEWLNKI